MVKHYTIKLISARFSEHSGAGVIEYATRLAKALRREKSMKVYGSAIIKDNPFIISKQTNKSLNLGEKIRNPDLLHYTDPGALTMDAFFIRYFLHKPKFIVTVHDLYVFKDVEPVSKLIKSHSSIRALFKKPIRIKSLIKRFFIICTGPIAIINLIMGIKFAVKYSDKLICVSEKTRDILINKFKIAREKCEVVYPIVGKEFKPLNVKKNGKIIIGHISSYFPNKNAGVLIDAFKELPGNDFELHLYGSALPFRIDDDKRIKYYGFIPTNEIPKIMNSFDVFVFPSAWEGFGAPIMEAKKCKTPVITYKNGELTSIVKRNTLQFVDKKELIKLLKNHRWKNIDVNKAYNDTKRCNPDYVAKRLSNVYKEVIERKNA